MKPLLIVSTLLLTSFTYSTPYITTIKSFKTATPPTPSYISSTEASLATTRDYGAREKDGGDEKDEDSFKDPCANGCQCDYKHETVFKANCDVSLMEWWPSENSTRDSSFHLLYSYGPSLKILMLENCVEEIEMFEWKNWPNLEILNIRNCSVNSSMFDRFEGLVNLEEFSFTESNLESLEVSCSSLEKNRKINLSKNELKSLYLCPHETKTKHLNLSENSFELFDIQQISGMKYLETFDLSKNQYLRSLIASSSPEKMKYLSTIDLSFSSMLSKICNNVIYLVPNLEFLDVRNTSLETVPSYLPRLEKLSQLNLEGTTPLCDCQLESLMSSLQNKTSSGSDLPNYCKIPKTGEGSGFETVDVTTENISSSLNCDKVELFLDQENENETDIVFVHSRERIDCILAEEGVSANIMWVTPRKLLLRQFAGNTDTCQSVNDRVHLEDTDTAYDSQYRNIELLSNGSLIINDFGWIDRGIYQCFANNGVSNDTIQVNKKLDFHYKNRIYYWSLIIGFTSAAAFLALTLLCKLLQYVLWNYGCCICCGCCHDRIAPKTKKLRKVVDSIESYRSQQLDKLTDSYSLQSEKIRENCTFQMEKVRENYSKQTKAAKDMRTYGSVQCTLVRDQYFDQISRIRDYSMMQLEKCHENYIFQRQRLRKFSAQNYLKIRETKKYTQKTLTKVLDNMPALYHDLTSCRQGVGDPRVESMYYDGELDLKEIELLDLDSDPRWRGLRDMAFGDAESVYFTPSGTPMRDPSSPKATSTDPYEELYRTDDLDEVDAGPSTSKEGVKGHRRMVSNLSSFLPFWWGMGQGIANSQDQEQQTGTTTVIIENSKRNAMPDQASSEAKVNESMLEDTDSDSRETAGAQTDPDTDSQETITNTTSLLPSTDSSQTTI